MLDLVLRAHSDLSQQIAADIMFVIGDGAHGIVNFRPSLADFAQFPHFNVGERSY
jgi:hypothetical protein